MGRNDSDSPSSGGIWIIMPRQSWGGSLMIRVDSLCEGPGLVATSERFKALKPTRRAKVWSGSKGSGSLSYNRRISNDSYGCADNIHTFHRIRSFGSTVDVVVLTPLVWMICFKSSTSRSTLTGRPTLNGSRSPWMRHQRMQCSSKNIAFLRSMW